MKDYIKVIKDTIEHSRLSGNNNLLIQSELEKITRLINDDIIEKDDFEKEFYDLVMNTDMEEKTALFMLSALVKIFDKTEYMELFLEFIHSMETINIKTLDMLIPQISMMLVKNPELNSKKVGVLYNGLYDELINVVRSEIILERQSKDKRDAKKVVVMTAQLLSNKHPATHSTLERCRILKQMGYEVTIIVVGSGPRFDGNIEIYNQEIYNVENKYDGIHMFQFEGDNYILYQEEKDMLTEGGIFNLVDVIKGINPLFVMFVGGRHYISDLINDMYPVVTVSTNFSNIPNVNTDFVIVGRRIDEQERKKYKSELIEVPFTFSITEKKKTYSRIECGIPEDKFVLAMVGNRLDADVSKEFIDILKALDNIFVVFIGNFNTYNTMVEADMWIRNNTMFTGVCGDVVGMLEVCDLYVNPKRLGGGFSVIEAFHAGLPAVSIKYGDVATAAGEEFCVDDYDSMIYMINKYKSDRAFYQEMVNKGKYREAYITDGYRLFEAGINKILKSKNFF